MSTSTTLNLYFELDLTCSRSTYGMMYLKIKLINLMKSIKSLSKPVVIIDFYRLIDKIDKNQLIFIYLLNSFFLSIFID